MSAHVAEMTEEAASLVIPRRLEALRPMSVWLDAELRRHEVPESRRADVDLCAHEAITNVISYAYVDDAVHDIVLRVYREGDMLWLEVEDDGVAFDPLARPAHVLPRSLDEAQIGGLGVHLIRSLMTECRYARRGGRNLLGMGIRLE